MGFSVSWVAFNGVPPPEVLSAVGLRGTDIVEEVPEAPFQTAALPNGWTVLFAADVMFAQPDRLRELSRHHDIIGCMVEEHAMVSMASRYAHGELVWKVVHDPSSSPSELRISGSPPPELAAVRDRASRGGAGAGNAFEIPIDLADEVCGFRHDAIRPDWKMVMFTVAVPNRP